MPLEDAPSLLARPWWEGVWHLAAGTGGRPVGPELWKEAEAGPHLSGVDPKTDWVQQPHHGHVWGQLWPGRPVPSCGRSLWEPKHWGRWSHGLWGLALQPKCLLWHNSGCAPKPGAWGRGLPCSHSRV